MCISVHSGKQHSLQTVPVFMGGAGTGACMCAVSSSSGVSNPGTEPNSLASPPPAIQETRVQSLGREDPFEKVMATHSSILAWRIPWTGEPGGLQSMGSQSRTRRKQLSTHTQRMSRLHFFFHLVIRVLVKTQEKALNQS